MVTGPEPRHRVLFAVLAVGLGLVVGLIAAEVLLRQTGHEPWREFAFDFDMPPMHEPDPELGWVNQPGTYVYGNPPIHVTFWADHTRATAPAPVAADATIVVLGCSFVEGFALSDQDTFAWKLQERFPRARVRNFGTAAYGTTQSLLALRRFLDERKRAAATGPLVVVYGFSDFHAPRNVATASWVKNLALLATRRHVATPWADLASDGTLRLHGPKAFPAWWLHRQLATVAFLEDQWAVFDARTRTTEQILVTEQLLVELDRTVHESGGTLLVALLSRFQKNALQPFRTLLRAHGIPTADCVHNGVWLPSMQVPVYGHPNAEINDYWAQCIAGALPRVTPDLEAVPGTAPIRNSYR